MCLYVFRGVDLPVVRVFLRADQSVESDAG